MRINILGGEERINSSAGIALAAIFTVAGVALAGYGFTQYQGQTENIENAVNITATVTDTDVRTDSSRRGRIDYQAEIRFNYRYEGENQSSNYIYPLDSDKEFDSESNAEEYLEDYLPGQEVDAFVNPENPSEAFLNAQRSNQPLILMIIGSLMAILGSIKTVQRIV